MTSIEGDKTHSFSARSPRQDSARTIARFELSQRFYFEAAHTLNRTLETEGSLRIHGHTYDAEVTVEGVPDAESGMLVDLAYLRREIARVRELLDHHFLDEVSGLGPATLENLCAFIRSQLARSVPNLSAVMVERRASGDRCVLRLCANVDTSNSEIPDCSAAIDAASLI